MESRHMMRNIGIGMAAGAALGLLMAPQKKTLKATAKKPVRADFMTARPMPFAAAYFGPSTPASYS